MKVFFLWHYYPRYLHDFEMRHPALAQASFIERRRVLLADHYGWPAELAAHMAGRGLETEFVVGNAERFQKQWAAENGFTSYSAGEWERAIALEQIRRSRPDILWISQRAAYYGPFVREALRYARRAMIWVGEPWPTPPDLDGIAVLVTENPATFREAQHRFERVIVTKPGFCRGILNDLGTVAKVFDVAFVGQFTRVHRRRAEIVAHLLRHGVRVAVWGDVEEGCLPGLRAGCRLALWHGIKQRSLRQAGATVRRMLRPSSYERDASAVARVCQAPVFGTAMFRTLASARLVLNVHADIAGGYAGNMRLFEATGVGSCLVTDAASNLSELFEPGREVLTYGSKTELPDLIRAALGDPARVERIARAGQQRTLKEHTLQRFFDDVRCVFAG